MRDTARPRRKVNAAALRLLAPLFRYSNSREAYVLRVIGRRYGPVLTPGDSRRTRASRSE